MTSNYKMMQCGFGVIRYIREEADGQLWFSLNDTFNALQVPTRVRTSNLFEKDEIEYKVFSHEKLKRPMTILSVCQSGLLKIILRSDVVVFRSFKTWLSNGLLRHLYGEDYMLSLMPYIQGSRDPNTLKEGGSIVETDQ